MKQFASFRLDTANERLWHNGAQLTLPPKPFAVLRYLVEHPGRLITHDELLDALWPETYVQPQVLRTYMLELRKVLGDDPGQPRFIQTLPKRGYCFVAVVEDYAETQRDSTPNVAHSAKPPAIVGRTEEMARLAAQAALMARGHRQVVFITGEAGIGKTALADAFSQVVSTDLPSIIARGQCIEGLACKEEYYPVMEALGQLCASPDGERVYRVLARMAPAWLGAHKRESSGAENNGDSRGAGERMPGDLCGALEEIAAERPLVLILEDLHWADPSTLHLISALARRRAKARLMVLVTYRQRDVSTDHPLKGLKQDLLVHGQCTELALPPLARSAVRELLSRELKQESLPPGLTHFVHEHSEGNPLFVIAILEHLIAQCFLVRDEVDGTPQWKQSAPFHDMEAQVPDGLAQMIELEIQRLGPQEQRMLEAGSLISVAFPAWAVAAALEEGGVETEDACDALAQRLHFLERAGEDELPDGTTSAFYVFAHGLYREVLYQRQAAAKRAKRHIRVAERLGLMFAGREASVAREMAMHYEAAASWERALHALRNAAQHALQRQAYIEAAELLGNALRMAENLGEAELEAVEPEIQGELARALEGAHLRPRQSLNPVGHSSSRVSTKA